jgi:hypothetical protein
MSSTPTTARPGLREFASMITPCHLDVLLTLTRRHAATVPMVDRETLLAIVMLIPATPVSVVARPNCKRTSASPRILILATLELLTPSLTLGLTVGSMMMSKEFFFFGYTCTFRGGWVLKKDINTNYYA